MKYPIETRVEEPPDRRIANRLGIWYQVGDLGATLEPY